MSVGAEQLKVDLIDRVVERVRQRLEPERARETEGFVRQFYAHVPPDDILGDDPDNLYGAALALYAFGAKRTPGEARLRVYNPDLEEHGWKSSHTVVEIINDDMPFLVDSVTAALAGLETQVHLVIHPIVTVERDGRGRLSHLFEAEDAPAPAAGGKAKTAGNTGGKRGTGRQAAKAESTGTAAKAKRDGKAGKANRPAGGQALRESFMHVEISEQPSERLAEIKRTLEGVLADVRLAVADWRAMHERLAAIVKELETGPPPVAKDELQEGIAFLRWVADNHFTFLGYREYLFEGEGPKAVARVLEDTGLGILRDPEYRVFEGLRNLGALPAEVREFLRQPDLLRITKANRRATVHRAVHMDTIAVKIFGRKGEVVGERLFVGLFTSVAYSRSPRDIPLLRRKVERIIERSGFPPNSHDGKALTHILDSYPRDELFQASEDELYDIAIGVLHLQERQRIALFLRRDPFERFVSCLVYVPRDRYDTDLRLRFQQILAQAFEGAVAAFYTHLTDAALARLHVIVRTTPGRIPEVDRAAVEQRLSDAARSWVDNLQDALVEDRGEEPGLAATRRFGKAFPASYQDHFNAHSAVFDIARIERALETGELGINLYRPIEAGEEQVRLKIYNIGKPIPLSDILPMQENMGLKVIAEHPYDIRPSDLDHPVWIHDFEMTAGEGAAIDLSAVKDKFHEAFARVWRGEMENDGFNRLVLLAGLEARDIVVLRAYCKYLRQAAIPFSQDYMEETLAANPVLAARLVELFHTLFDPARKNREKAAGRIAAAIEEGLEEVSNLDQDRIIRRYLNAIASTLRTNYYQEAEGGGAKPYLSFKLDSQAIEELPLPKPFREIFVYSPRVEAVHLRFGRVARGGLRWSDRREDFRTEVLGLVKAQQVKNAVIVPVGSKGGFVVKRPPAGGDRQAIQDEGIACYKLFIGGMLDITDNLVAGEVAPPPQVVRRDDDDPYLVVAADKGTATFSDIANGVSQAYGFWLDDAFASGGSAGYDHKAMGITARGGWESVKRHFRELGKDIQSEDFTCVGCGDMSGDVFGNGMLLSEHTRLLAAFNHLHIFVDPNPDAARSWKERKRLFETRGQWSDYDAKLISKGGGVFERKAKSVKLTKEMKQMLGVEADSLTPNELIRAILKADSELLWFGGIGTYVKAKEESNVDAGDRANDAVRVNAEEVGARVVGEGANLGLTQRGRIAYALAGGHINTDFIDNSAGVDCSDHEVNIKILLGEVEAAGDMTRKQRDQLLERMTEEVARLVLRDNYLQTQALSVTQTLGVHLLDRIARFMRTLERAGKLDRFIESLPDDEMIADRRKAGLGMTRPELSVLLCYAKMTLYEELLDSGLPDDSYMEGDLKAYFPKPLQEKFAQEIGKHRLRREIIATAVTNSIVNRVGVTFILEVKEKTGMEAADIARCYAIGREVFGIRKLWADIEALDNKASAALQYTLLTECGRLVERGTTWFLRMAAQPIGISREIEAYAEGVNEIASGLDQIITKGDGEMLAERTARFAEQGAPKALARQVANLALLPPALDIVHVAGQLGIPVKEAGRTYFTIGARFGFDWLRRAAGHLPTDDAWDKLALTAIIDDFYSHQSELTRRVLERADGKAGETVIDEWAKDRRPLVARTEQLLAELRSAGTPDLAMLAVANRQLKSMVAQ